MSDKLDRDTLFRKLRAKPENKAGLITVACLATPATVYQRAYIAD